ncbi:MAG: hypothetical protein VXY27_04930, partial [Thermoproteota archaeon]|nr:hypothetical protein [Thermoproteota archaeon]
NSNKIAIILERHENRLDESERTDALIIKMMEEMKETHVRDREVIHERITTLTKKVDQNAKFVVGAGAVLATMVTVLQVLPPLINSLTPAVQSVSMVSTDTHEWTTLTTNTSDFSALG